MTCIPKEWLDTMHSAKASLRSPRSSSTMRYFIILVLAAGAVSWIFVLLIMSKLHLNANESVGVVEPTSMRPTTPKRSLMCSVSPGAIPVLDVRSFQALRKLELEINSGWNHTDQPTRILPLGTHGYIKRDLPVYENALSQRTIAVLPKPPDGKFKDDRPFDSILCLSFTTESCLSMEDFTRIGRHRKVNRIKSLREVLWSKNNFCDTLTTATRNYDATDFFFPCWNMPEQYDQMIADSKRLKITRWISKPKALGAGMGISIVDDLREIRRGSNHVIQEYMQQPHLLKGADGEKHKWDMRTYVLVTSVFPLRAYVYQRGLVRLATSPYSTDCKSNNQTACLTNTSINKKMVGAKLKDITWSFKRLKDYLGESVYRGMFLRMQRAIGMTLLSALPGFAREWEGTGDNCASCYQLLGVDVIFDDKLNPKVIECNGEPSMQLTSGGKTHYDITKKSMILDLVSTVFQDRSAARNVHGAFASATSMCGSKNVKIRRTDAMYILDMFRERMHQSEFAPVYPNVIFHEEYGRFLDHLANSANLGKSVRKTMKELALSHSIIDEILQVTGNNEKPIMHAVSDVKPGKKGSKARHVEPVVTEPPPDVDDADDDDIDDV